MSWSTWNSLSAQLLPVVLSYRWYWIKVNIRWAKESYKVSVDDEKYYFMRKTLNWSNKHCDAILCCCVNIFVFLLWFSLFTQKFLVSFDYFFYFWLFFYLFYIYFILYLFLNNVLYVSCTKHFKCFQAPSVINDHKYQMFLNVKF